MLGRKRYCSLYFIITLTAVSLSAKNSPNHGNVYSPTNPIAVMLAPQLTLNTSTIESLLKDSSLEVPAAPPQVAPRRVTAHKEENPQHDFSRDELSESGKRKIKFLNSSIDVSWLRARLEQANRTIWYPCSLNDFGSLHIILSLLKVKQHIVFEDKFDPKETVLEIPDASDYPGIVSFLRESFSLNSVFADVFDTLIVNNHIYLTIRTFYDGDDAAPGNDTYILKYLIRDYKEEKETFDAIYVRMPGKGGKLSDQPAFWSYMEERLAPNGLLVVSNEFTRHPSKTLFAEVATVAAVPLSTRQSPKHTIYMRPHEFQAALLENSI